MIEAFILSGYYPSTVKICAEGSEEWRSPSPLVLPHPNVTSVPDTRPAAQPEKAKSEPLYKGDARSLWWIGGVGAFFLLCYYSSNSGNSSSKYSPNYAASAPLPAAADTLPQSPEPQPLVSEAGSSSPSADTSNAALVGISPTSQTNYPPATGTPADVEYTTATGNTYRVSNSNFIRLTRQRTVLDQEDAALSAAQAQLEVAETRLERQRATLDRTNQYEVQDFNKKVDALNAMRRQVSSRIDAFNNGVGSFNAELHRVGTLVR